jgi:16S rRNA (cytosine1402-N4)-methyltransferase
MNEDIVHVPVLLHEVLENLKLEPNKVFIDGTVGQGGHAEELLRVLPEVRLLAIDRDPHNLAVAKNRLVDYTDAVIFVCDSYANIKQITYGTEFTQVDGILLDLGYSSYHVEDASRGFSFMAEGILDMRYNPEGEGMTAKEIVNQWDEDELAKIFRKYGEERQARRIAQLIISARQQQEIETTTQLADIVARGIRRTGRTHPATKIFQALRIAVNNELGELERALPDLVDCLKPGGRLTIISFHSLEDRIVKQFMKSRDDLTVLTKKPVIPTEAETKTNPRARSAKLRVAEKQ